MPKPRYILRLILAFFVRFKEIIVISVFFGFLLFILLNFLSPYFLNKNTEIIAMTGRYSSTELPTSVLNLIGDGLTSLDESGNAQAGLASEWESLENGKVWKFILADNLVWQDGTPVTSGSIQYSFEDVEIERPDDRTIIFKLQESFAPFPVVVSKATFKKGLLGTGEWEVKQLSLAGTYVEKLTLQNKKGNKKVIKFYPTEERAKLAFKLGEVNQLQEVIEPSPLNKWSTVKIQETPNTNRFAAVFFNNADPAGLVSEKTIRQALSYAIDKDQLSGARVISPIPPTSWAYNPQTKPYDYDEKRAKELIEDTDLPDDKKLEIKLVTIPILLTTAERIAQDWEKAGVKTTVQVSAILPQDYQAFLTYYDVPRDPDQYSTWHSSQEETNITKYRNVRIDKLLQDGRIEGNQDQRKAIYLDFQRFLLEDAPAAFLFHPQSYTISRK